MGIYDIDRDCVCSLDERYIALCAGCGKEMLKRRMIAVMARRGSRVPRTVAHFCEDCYAGLCDTYQFEDK